MSWLRPRTTRQWFVLIVLGALILSQIASIALLAGQQTVLRSTLHETEAFRRTAGLLSLTKGADAATRRTIEETATGPSFLVRFAPEPIVPKERRDNFLSEALARGTGNEPEAVRVAWDTTRANIVVKSFKRKDDRRTFIITEHRGPTIRALPPSETPDEREAVDREVHVEPDVPADDDAALPLFTSPGSVTAIPAMPAVPPVPPVPPAPPEPSPPPPPAPMSPRGFNWFVSPVEIQVKDDGSPPPERLDISVEVEPKVWLNVSAVPPAVPSAMLPLILAGGLAAVLVAIAAIWAAGRVARPIAGLTTAAERMGRGDGLVLAPEEGPQDVRAAASAFNTMATRLRRLIEDQRALLSAVGHDLRTPLASLRIRTESVKDAELQGRMLNSIGEIERLTEAALAAARGGETGEPTRPVDLPSLIEAVCDDLSDMGSPVTFGELPALRVDGRASELRRALRNLIENGVRYGVRARVSLSSGGGFVELHVDDDGPGIPEAQLGNVMKPFVRLEESRSVETGGHGLGLTIARAIAERHGGELMLKNRAEGGLRATLKLPLAQG